jgi:hypothetical protein
VPTFFNGTSEASGIELLDGADLAEEVAQGRSSSPGRAGALYLATDVEQEDVRVGASASNSERPSICSTSWFAPGS